MPKKLDETVKTKEEKSKREGALFQEEDSPVIASDDTQNVLAAEHTSSDISTSDTQNVPRLTRSRRVEIFRRMHDGFKKKKVSFSESVRQNEIPGIKSTITNDIVDLYKRNQMFCLIKRANSESLSNMESIDLMFGNGKYKANCIDLRSLASEANGDGKTVISEFDLTYTISALSQLSKRYNITDESAEIEAEMMLKLVDNIISQIISDKEAKSYEENGEVGGKKKHEEKLRLTSLAELTYIKNKLLWDLVEIRLSPNYLTSRAQSKGDLDPDTLQSQDSQSDMNLAYNLDEIINKHFVEDIKSIAEIKSEEEELFLQNILNSIVNSKSEEVDIREGMKSYIKLRKVQLETANIPGRMNIRMSIIAVYVFLGVHYAYSLIRKLCKKIEWISDSISEKFKAIRESIRSNPTAENAFKALKIIINVAKVVLLILVMLGALLAALQSFAVISVSSSIIAVLLMETTKIKRFLDAMTLRFAKIEITKTPPSQYLDNKFESFARYIGADPMTLSRDYNDLKKMNLEVNSSFIPISKEDSDSILEKIKDIFKDKDKFKGGQETMLKLLKFCYSLNLSGEFLQYYDKNFFKSASKEEVDRLLLNKILPLFPITQGGINNGELIIEESGCEEIRSLLSSANLSSQYKQMIEIVGLEVFQLRAVDSETGVKLIEAGDRKNRFSYEEKLNIFNNIALSALSIFPDGSSEYGESIDMLNYIAQDLQSSNLKLKDSIQESGIPISENDFSKIKQYDKEMELLNKLIMDLSVHRNNYAVNNMNKYTNSLYEDIKKNKCTRAELAKEANIGQNRIRIVRGKRRRAPLSESIYNKSRRVISKDDAGNQWSESQNHVDIAELIREEIDKEKVGKDGRYTRLIQQNDNKEGQQIRKF